VLQLGTRYTNDYECARVPKLQEVQTNFIYLQKPTISGHVRMRKSLPIQNIHIIPSLWSYGSISATAATAR
jgi:hypothetical protein